MKTWHKVAGAGALATAVSLACFMEGEKLVAYNDPGDHHTITICSGRTDGVFLGMTQTHEQCAAWLTPEMAKRIAFVDSVTVVRQPDNIRAALADFAFNEGNEALRGSLALREINRGQIRKGCMALKNWTRSGNTTLPGLVTRRNVEISLCLEGVKP